MEHCEDKSYVTSRFPVTRWSVILAAGEADSPQRTQALEDLCRAYWRPLFGFVRQQGNDFHRAQDLTQDFFTHLLTKNPLSELSPDRGRFRTFLLVALKHRLANERDRAQTLKRGGGAIPISLDDLSDEHALSPASSNRTPEEVFDRQWALTVLDRALVALRQEFSAADKSTLFEELKTFLSREGSGAEYDLIGARLQMTGGAVAVAVFRMRQDYRRLVRLEIAHTVATPWEIDTELRYLLDLVTA